MNMCSMPPKTKEVMFDIVINGIVTQKNKWIAKLFDTFLKKTSHSCISNMASGGHFAFEQSVHWFCHVTALSSWMRNGLKCHLVYKTPK